MPKTAESALAELADLGASLGDAIADEQTKKETIGKILDTIGALDKDTAKSLFKNEKVQRLIELASGEMADTGTLPPGSYMPGPMGMKVPWSEDYLNRLIAEGKMELVRNYRPITTKRVIYQGLERQFVARRPITCPQCFVDVYEGHLNAEDLAAQHAEWLFGKTNQLTDWSVVNEGSVKVRGTGTRERSHYVPGGGLVDMSDREGV